ncbi:MAG: MBL fold metallo-hydrolase [Alphaproteobacteria bacterium]|nr:MBL fold metallo-hydrolase [Alphaproteobacteria bacterium]
MIEPVDRIRITVVVDNVTDNLSSNPPGISTETARAAREPDAVNDFNCLCCAAHGLSLHVTAWRGSEARTILFDTGPTEMAFRWNLFRLRLTLADIEGIVLSHGHMDHAGALALAVALARDASGGRHLPVYLHPHMFARRAVRRAEGVMVPFIDMPTPELLGQLGADAVVTREPQAACDGTFWISGEIPRVSGFERGFPGQMRETAPGQWEKDEIMPDERFMAVRLRGRGVVVFSACSHAGIVNVVEHARKSFPDDPIHLVMGGFHLVGPNEAIIAPTVEGLARLGVETIAPAHCTGWRAVTALANRFGEPAVRPAAVGKIYTLDAA